MKLEFSRQVFEKRSNSNFMKIRPLGAELFNASGKAEGIRTDMTKLTAAFRNSANAPKNSSYHPILKLNAIWKGNTGLSASRWCCWLHEKYVRAVPTKFHITTFGLNHGPASFLTLLYVI